jgi:hypothetical protein
MFCPLINTTIWVIEAKPFTAKGKTKSGLNLYPNASLSKNEKEVSTAFHGNSTPMPHKKNIYHTSPFLSLGTNYSI